MKSPDVFTLRTTVYSDKPYISEFSTADVFQTAESEKSDTLHTPAGDFCITVYGYPSAFNPSDKGYEVMIAAPERIGTIPASVELVGAGSDVEFFTHSDILCSNPLNSALNAGEYTHNINVPSSAPAVISVGMSSYRTGFLNQAGDWIQTTTITDGLRSPYSSVGPTIDGRMKPDVTAPGINVISSYNSFYREANPNASNAILDVSYSEVNGRKYVWNANSGTSMSSPVVGGIIALWLEANPELTPAQILEILSKTGRHADPSLAYPNNQYGHGDIDAYSGLLEVLRQQGLAVEGLSSHQPQSVEFSLTDNQLDMRFLAPLSAPVTVCVYALDGTLLQKETIPVSAQNYQLSFRSQQAGVYAIQLNSPTNGMQGSTLVRIR